MAKRRQAPVKTEDAAEVLSFEGALEQLETTVGRLEEGEMPLEEALELFEKGVALSRRCSETLEAAEKRIEILVAESDADGEPGTSEPFEPQEEAFED
ncbi:MAG: exodeoxyribonuclease VII small subunit, partial [Myxococcota bacterium]